MQCGYQIKSRGLQIIASCDRNVQTLGVTSPLRPASPALGVTLRTAKSLGSLLGRPQMMLDERP